MTYFLLHVLKCPINKCLSNVLDINVLLGVIHSFKQFLKQQVES